MSDIATTAGAHSIFDWGLVNTGKADLSSFTLRPCLGTSITVERLSIFSLEIDATLDTAIILSLFCDRRADSDAVLPTGQTNRRGWCGDEFMQDKHPFGSHLWLGYISKTTDERLQFMRFAALESLQWLIDDGIANEIIVDASWLNDGRLSLRIKIVEKDHLSPLYDVVWATTLREYRDA